MCGREVENLMHLIMECGELKSFFEKMWNLLCLNWGRAFIENLEKKQLFLFGNAKNIKFNINLLNFVVSHARYAIWCMEYGTF